MIISTSQKERAPDTHGFPILTQINHLTLKQFVNQNQPNIKNLCTLCIFTLFALCNFTIFLVDVK